MPKFLPGLQPGKTPGLFGSRRPHFGRKANCGHPGRRKTIVGGSRPPRYPAPGGTSPWAYTRRPTHRPTGSLLPGDTGRRSPLVSGQDGLKTLAAT